MEMVFESLEFRHGISTAIFERVRTKRTILFHCEYGHRPRFIPDSHSSASSKWEIVQIHPCRRAPGPTPG